MTVKTYVEVTEYNFRNYTVWWQISKYINVSHTFWFQVLPFRRYNNFTFVCLRNTGKGHGWQFLQLLHWMVNVKISIFLCALALLPFHGYNFFNIFIFKQGHLVHLSQLHLSIVDVKLNKCLTHIVVITMTISEIYKFIFFTSTN